MLGVVVVQVGLARAGVVGWWAVPVPVICLLGAFALPLSMPRRWWSPASGHCAAQPDQSEPPGP